MNGPSKRELIEREFFSGDDRDFIDGTFDGASSHPPMGESDEYRIGYHYGRVVLPFENPVLWADIHQCRS